MDIVNCYSFLRVYAGRKGSMSRKVPGYPTDKVKHNNCDLTRQWPAFSLLLVQGCESLVKQVFAIQAVWTQRWLSKIFISLSWSMQRCLLRSACHSLSNGKKLSQLLVGKQMLRGLLDTLELISYLRVGLFSVKSAWQCFWNINDSEDIKITAATLCWAVSRHYASSNLQRSHNGL